MQSTSIPYLVFLALTFALYWAVHRHRVARLGVLLVASLCFYVAWTPLPILVFFVGAGFDHLVVKGLARAKSPRARKALVTASVVFNLGLLGTFKYADLFRQTAQSLLAPLGVHVRAEPFGWLLPVGLSFLCFQAISYVVDVYRGKASAEHSYLEHLLYLLFFPRVVSGPIVRASALLERFNEVPTLTPEAGGRALYRIAVGLVKKLVIADVLGSGLVDPVFGNPEAYTSAECLVAAVAYTFELYLDFSGYSDVAIGAAALFGFEFPENFQRPYLARNLFEFWNRWHMSLSSWLRDYLYIPLGGNRRSKPRVLFNLMTVMVLGGLWHGADWRFAIWGAVHGVGLGLLRTWWWIRGGRPEAAGPGRVGLGMLVTFTVVVLTRVVFRAPDLAHAGEFYARMALGMPGLDNVSGLVWAMLGVAVVSHMLPMRLFHDAGTLFVRMPVPVRAVVLVLIGLGIRHLSAVETRPYVYLQF
ncbi:MBOAT family O-acyltransferase [Stigmatella aurantiaca]|uniref:Alginate biosynthesis protein AlgI n=1 Tax=Stigmatella aurantiaca (strain DW4/3-1) TaxID=378806 RepID=Q09A99_STIAD|nr:MBOAT family protein [Stigmatella aurantiaca]ADO75053.1 Alginate biosynthesis protein AlgI [Stigmatella aurantiaca DW4/3-1]EAU68655.1 alginate biosynthesis protein AlgI [Stigmatella aurantiaca DW4/3-1]